jgi:ASC-1-like (ASCH) protein
VELPTATKKYTLRFRAKDRINFLEIKDVKKKIETRAATEKYRKIQKGDSLIFVCGKERLEKKIKKVEIFKSLDAMFKAVNPKHIMPSLSTTAEMTKAYYSYPEYKEKIKKFGIIAFWI